MPGRRRAREIALLALYQSDLADNEPAEALRGAWAAAEEDEERLLLRGEKGSEERAFTHALVDGVAQRREEIDALIAYIKELK